MGQKKMCPLLTAVFLQATSPMNIQQKGLVATVEPNFKMFFCQGEACAWWVPDFQGCALSVMAEAVIRGCKVTVDQPKK